jgi:DNA-binding MarR family transcriptional regulator
MCPQRSTRLSIMQFRAMVLLRSAPAANLSAVAEYLGASLPTASRVVTSRVSAGLVTRREGQRDRRQVELLLTPRGVAAMNKARESTQAQLARELSSLASRDAAVLLQALKLLHDIFAPGLRSAGEFPEGSCAVAVPNAVIKPARVPRRKSRRRSSSAVAV